MSEEIILRQKIELPIFHEPDKLEKAKLLINQLGKNLHEHAYVVGKLLIWVREQIRTTKFMEEWIPDNVWFSYRTARHFIGFSKKCDSLGFLIEYHPKKENISMATVAIAGQYQTLIIDPPWPIEKVERTERPLQAAKDTGLDYPTMTIEAIQNSQYPFSENCHIYRMSGI